MNARYMKILRRVGTAEKPIEFAGADAILAAELIDGGLVDGSSVRGENGVVILSVATGLTFQGRCAIDDASFLGHVSRLYDLLIGVVIGVVTGGVGSFLGMLLAKTVLK